MRPGPLPPLFALAALFCLVALAACGSSSGHAADAAADAFDDAGGGDAPIGDGLCNPLTQLGAPVTPVCAGGSKPAATGGAIVDGTYVLTASRFFGDCSTAVLAETLEVSQGTVQSIATAPDGSEHQKSVTYTLGSNGTTLAETQTCPTRIMTTVSFDATPTTLTIYLSTVLATRVSTFTLQ